MRGDGWPPELIGRGVEEMYAEREVSAEETVRLLDASLDPRGPDLLFELANCLWAIYQMIGKLSPTVYLLRR